MTEKVQTYEEAIKKTIVFWVEKSFRTRMNQDNGDAVIVDFEEAGKINNCNVIKVHFTESKVLYDIQVSMRQCLTRIYNIDSVFVYPVEN